MLRLPRCLMPPTPYADVSVCPMFDTVTLRRHVCYAFTRYFDTELLMLFARTTLCLYDISQTYVTISARRHELSYEALMLAALLMIRQRDMRVG